MTDEERWRYEKKTEVARWLNANMALLPMSDQLYLCAAYEQLYETIEPIYDKYHRGKARAEKIIAEKTEPVDFSVALMKQIMKMKEENEREQQPETETEEQDASEQ